MSTTGYIEPQIVLGLLLGEEPTKQRKMDVAKLLQKKVNRSNPYSVSYLENIVAGRQEASPHGDMYRALMLVMEEVVGALIERVDE